MGIFSPGGGSSSSTSPSGAATTPLVANVSMTLAGTEYSYALPVGTKKFGIKLRQSAPLLLAYALGASGTTYLTIPTGCNFEETELNATGVVLYFQSSQAAQVAEITTWT